MSQTADSSTASSAADSCGTAPAGGYASAASGGYTAQNTVSAGSAYCSMVKHVFLLLFTFGIWYFIWIYRTTRYLNRVEGEEYRNPTYKLLLCMFVPFYLIYWVDLQERPASRQALRIQRDPLGSFHAVPDPGDFCRGHSPHSHAG